MSQITLKLHEILTLEAELGGFTNLQTGEKVLDGFLKEKLSLGTKYRLSKLSDELKKEKSIIDALRDDLIKEYGEEKDGQITISMFDKEDTKAPNPKFIEFQSKYSAFLEEEKEIDYSPIPVSELDKIESNDNYTILFKLVADND